MFAPAVDRTLNANKCAWRMTFVFITGRRKSQCYERTPLKEIDLKNSPSLNQLITDVLRPRLCSDFYPTTTKAKFVSKHWTLIFTDGYRLHLFKKLSVTVVLTNTPSQNRLNRKFGTLGGTNRFLPPTVCHNFFSMNAKKKIFLSRKHLQICSSEIQKLFSRCFLPPSQGSKIVWGRNFCRKQQIFGKSNVIFFCRWWR